MLALIVWSLVMLTWMYALRIPAMRKAVINPANAKEPTSLDGLPLQVTGDLVERRHHQPRSVRT